MQRTVAVVVVSLSLLINHGATTTTTVTTTTTTSFNPAHASVKAHFILEYLQRCRREPPV
jgi:hypothetical protein